MFTAVRYCWRQTGTYFNVIDTCFTETILRQGHDFSNYEDLLIKVYGTKNLYIASAIGMYFNLHYNAPMAALPRYKYEYVRNKCATLFSQVEHRLRRLTPPIPYKQQFIQSL